MIPFAKRNIQLYLRNRASVLFSLLGVFIILILYLLFLADNMASSLDTLENARLFIDAWLMAGLCAIAPVTSCMGAAGILVADRENKISRDFLTTPIKRYKLAGGYLLGSMSAAFIISFIVLALCLVWLLFRGFPFFSVQFLFTIFALQALSVIAGSSLIFFFVTFFHTHSAFTTGSTLIGSTIGFFTGLYLPIGNLPESVQIIVKLFPISHAAALMRNTMLSPISSTIFEGAPAEMQQELYTFLGVNFTLNENLISSQQSIVLLLATTLLFFSLSALRFREKSKL